MRYIVHSEKINILLKQNRFIRLIIKLLYFFV